MIGVFLKPHQLPYQVFFHAAEHYKLLASTETVSEIVDVVAREKFDRFRDRVERQQALAHYLGIVERLEPTVTVMDCRDPKDNKFLSLALSAKAELIVSSDDDLLVLNPYQGIRVLTVRQYAEENGLVLPGNER